MKRALLVGINYVGTSNQLYGCINDINNTAAYLQSARGYPSGSFIVLSDVAARKPTRANILAAFKELLQGVQSGDELWFHYSGHGSLQRDNNRDEESGADSCICPLDFNKSGVITDDIIRSALALLVPAGARLYVVLDACHSGTGCDLRYKYDDTSYLSTGAPMPTSYNPAAWTLRQTSYEFKNYAKTAGEVYCISGCQDSQTSADAHLGGQAAGALTYCLLQALKANAPDTYKWKHLLKDVCCRERIGQFQQRTSITSGMPLNPEDLVFRAATPVTPVNVTPILINANVTPVSINANVTPVTVTPVTINANVKPVSINANVTPVTVTPVTIANVTPANVTPVNVTPVKPLPHWVQMYLLQLRQQKLQVPNWLRVYISQLPRGLSMDPVPVQKMKMAFHRY
jgi:hypothetical protein